MAAFVQRVFLDEATFGEQQQRQSADDSFVASGEDTWPSMSLDDLAAELVNGTTTCEELAHRVFSFFKVIRGKFFVIKPRRHWQNNQTAHLVALERLLHTHDPMNSLETVILSL